MFTRQGLLEVSGGYEFSVQDVPYGEYFRDDSQAFITLGEYLDFLQVRVTSGISENASLRYFFQEGSHPALQFVKTLPDIFAPYADNLGILQREFNLSS